MQFDGTSAARIPWGWIFVDGGIRLSELTKRGGCFLFDTSCIIVGELNTEVVQ